MKYRIPIECKRSIGVAGEQYKKALNHLSGIICVENIWMSFEIRSNKIAYIFILLPCFHRHNADLSIDYSYMLTDLETMFHVFTRETRQSPMEADEERKLQIEIRCCLNCVTMW